MKIYKILFAVFGFASVALGAFGAHGLKDFLSAYHLEIYQTGVSYQFYHTLALGVVLILQTQNPKSRALRFALMSFTVGIFIFSGSLYTLAFTQKSIFGAITPIGGVFFLLGWASILVWSLQEKNTSA